ncbi:Uncharacterised protein [Mycobacterium tuberculosis]|nr:Uncharacterised protein [Mycobacterium tuberculosis]
MGAQLVTLVFVRWTHVSDTAFRILMRMAVTALDHEKDGRPACLYFGGREPLARALRRPFPEGDSEKAKKARKNIYGDVRRAIKELVEEGAVEIVDTGKYVQVGHRQTYRLHLTVPHTAGRGPNPASGRGQNPPSGRDDSPPQGGDTPPPKEKGGTTGGAKSGGDGRSGHGPTGGAHARESAEQTRERTKSELLGVIDAQAASSAQDKPQRPPAPVCDCGTVLDPDGSCFVCRTAP